jgi:effector-binding domain-containing protein
MPKMNISRKININAPVDKVYNVVSNFHEWQPWSPWLMAEPEAKVTINENGKSYSWNGSRVGSGEMEVTNETDTHVDYNLIFLKPWKGKAKVTFDLKPKADTTEVKWTMDSNLPFFLFFIKKQTEAFIGMDYDRGLGMLKEYVETGNIESKLEFIGQNTYDGCHYVGITTQTPFAKVGENMERDFTKLYEWAQKNNVEITGEPFSQYHKFNPVKGDINYTAAIPVVDTSTTIPEGSKRGHLPKLNLHTVRHHGSYNHLGNAWSTIMMQQRNKEFKANKKIHPLEFYKNDPSETAPKDLITDVSFVLK